MLFHSEKKKAHNTLTDMRITRQNEDKRKD